MGTLQRDSTVQSADAHLSEGPSAFGAVNIASDSIESLANGAGANSDSAKADYIKRLEGLVLSLTEQKADMVVRRPRGRRYSSSSSTDSSSDSTDVDVEKDETSALDEGKEDGLRLEIKRQKRIYRRDYGAPTIHADRDDLENDSARNNLNKQHILTVYRDFDKSRNFWRKVVDIVSPALNELLHRLSPYDIDISEVDGVIKLTEPMMLLFHNRRYLQQFLENSEAPKDLNDKQCISHSKLILDFMRNDFADVSRKLDEIEALTPSCLIDFAESWLLYPPGTIVYAKDHGEYEGFVVDTVRGCSKSQAGRSGRHSYSRLEVTCWSIDYDGEVFGRVWSTHMVPPFVGAREVTSLDLVPEAFVPDLSAVKESLIARGRKFWSLQGQNYQENWGESWGDRKTGDVSRVMIDHMTWQRRHEWPICIDMKRGPAKAAGKDWRESKFNRLHRRNVDWSRRPPPPPQPCHVRHVVRRDHTIDDDNYSPERYRQHEEDYTQPHERVDSNRPPLRTQSKFIKYDVLLPDSEPDQLTLLLCSRRVMGYSFRERDWKCLSVSQLKPVVFQKNAWDRLVLDAEYKDIVQAMVSSYVDKTATLEDLVAGKGRGLVSLFHGPPGSGKTLTAECVAESFEKPLYQVTCGDIGTSPELLEENLGEIFEYAETWGAILLLDEADIFLQDRDYTNLERNALVSIFLRTLEYFSGILFLTTNRVGVFDQAFQSRIHVTLGLPSLSRPARLSVWRIFLADLAAKKSLSETQASTLDTLCQDVWTKEPLNGRQIRNAVRTALLIAEKKGEVVGAGHFETVLRIGREFGEYMSLLKRGEEDVVAEGKGERLADREGFEEVRGF